MQQSLPLGAPRSEPQAPVSTHTRPPSRPGPARPRPSLHLQGCLPSAPPAQEGSRDLEPPFRTARSRASCQSHRLAPGLHPATQHRRNPAVGPLACIMSPIQGHLKAQSHQAVYLPHDSSQTWATWEAGDLSDPELSLSFPFPGPTRPTWAPYHCKSTASREGRAAP